MSHFNVLVKTPSGETQRIIREADSQSVLLAALRLESLTPVKVESIRSSSETKGLFWSWRNRSQPSRKDLHAFMKSFATLLRSGMDVERCLKTLERESREPLRSIVIGMTQRVRQGETLSDSMERSSVFSPFHVRVIRAGELSGDLRLSFQRIVRFMDREAATRGKIRNAVAYPAFLLMFGFVSFTIMIVFILPKFTGIYKEMGTELPLLTSVLLRISSIIRQNALWLLPLGAFLIFTAVKYLLQFRQNSALDALRMKIPVLGRLVREMEVAALIRTLGLLLESGLPIAKALNMCARVCGSAIFSRAVLEIERGVLKGGKLSSEMRKQQLFPETVLSITSVGEESGRLEELLLSTSEEMEARMDEIVAGIVTFIEPVLIIAIGILIGLMVMATLLPIFKLSAGLRR